MVYFELSIQQRKTKLEVQPGSITFDEFKEKLAALFPKAQKIGGEFFIQFYDLDGVLQTISSDKAFQESISSMSIETHCRLYVCLKLN